MKDKDGVKGSTEESPNDWSKQRDPKVIVVPGKCASSVDDAGKEPAPEIPCGVQGIVGS